MSVATVVNRGYGTASYADVTKVPTIGYVSGAVTIFCAGLYRPGATESTDSLFAQTESTDSLFAQTETTDSLFGKGCETVQ